MSGLTGPSGWVPYDHERLHPSGSRLRPRCTGAPSQWTDRRTPSRQAPRGLCRRGQHRARRSLPKLALAGKFDALVGLEKSLAFNLGGHVLHTMYWANLSPDGGDKPAGDLAAAIDDQFGSFDAFRAHFSQATTLVQGSGWGILSYEPIGRPVDHRATRGAPPEHHAGRRAAAGDRRMGARLLPAVQQPSGPTTWRPSGTSSTGPTCARSRIPRQPRPDWSTADHTRP